MNDETVHQLCKQAVAQVHCDFIFILLNVIRSISQLLFSIDGNDRTETFLSCFGSLFGRKDMFPWQFEVFSMQNRTHSNQGTFGGVPFCRGLT